MKKFFEFLQQFGVAISILLATSPVFLNVIATTYGYPYVVWYSVALTLTGAVLTALFLWYLTSSWNLKKPGYFIAVGFSGFLSFLTGSTALIVLYGLLPVQFHTTVSEYSPVLLLGVLYGFYTEWCVNRQDTTR